MMSRRALTIALVAFLAVVATLWAAIVALGWQPRLGLDLQGGVSITMIPSAGQGTVEPERLEQTVDIIRERVDALGVAEPDIARQGGTIQVQLPGEVDQQRAEDVIGRTALLQFRPVLEFIPAGTPGFAELADCDAVPEGPPPPDTEVVLCGETQLPGGVEPADDTALPDDAYRLGPVTVPGEEIDDATAQVEPNGLNWFVALDFSGEGDRAFQEMTAELACEPPGSATRQLAIVLDGRVESAPEVAQDVACGQGIVGGGIITVGEQEEAQDLALVLRTGALPIELEFATSQSVSPTLGRDSLTAGLQAGLLGLALVALYLIALYRGLGALAVLELLMFGVIVVGLLIMLGETIGFTLTLAGIAGIIVSIGIAADSSIIYRERFRDERRGGRTVRSAAEHAFRRAFRTNLTGNTVSFLAAVVLWLLAVGPVRGFAFTLGLSTLVDTLLFATFTRSLFGLVARSPRLASSRWMGMRGVDAATTVGARRTRQKVGR